MGNEVDPELQVSGLPDLTGKLNYTGRRRAEDLAPIDGQTLRYTLAEREQQLCTLMEKLRERS